MTTFQSFQPRKLVNFPINNKPTLYSNQQHRVNYYYLNPRLHHNTSLRFSLNNDVSATDGFIHELFGRTESLVYTLADALASAPDGAKQSEDWLYGITNLMETVLKVLKDGLSALHVPYAYGFAIILLTVLVKAATFPLTKKQVESAMAMKSLQPQVNAIQKQFAGDQERIQLETARLYKIAGVNPLAGCLPTIATIPVWVGLYRALSNVANEGLLTEGFFWIPSLAGPTTIAAKQNGSGISWIFPFVDGHPPLGWSDTLAYLVLPLLLILSQYISVQIMQSSQNNDPNLKASQALSKFLPLMIGYFALSVPSGLSLYWFTNNILSTTQQIWLQKLGGAKSSIREFSDKSVKQVQKKLKGSVDKENSTNIMESRKEEKPSGGMRPGDRFKQIKEQEARKKEQMDEEKRKLAAITTESADKKLESVKTEDEVTEAKSVDVRDKIVKSLTAASEPPNQVPLVNGEHSFLSSNEDQKEISLPRAENGVVASTASDDGKEELLLHEDLEKDEATGTYTTTTPTGGVDPSKTAEHGRIEQPTKGDEN